MPDAISPWRRLGMGRALYHLWHRPKGWCITCLREGGPWQQYRTERGRRAMAAAASVLPPPAPQIDAAPWEVHLLTGHRFWYQSAFCLWTLAQTTGRPITPVLYDDGSLGAAEGASLRRLFPTTRIVDQAAAQARLDRHLPTAEYPTLRERWQHYPNLRKLIDPHLGRTGWKLILDSDLLFFRRPRALEAWLDAPQAPLHAVDCTESYGYTRPLLERLAGTPLPPLVNVGLCGLSSDALDWRELEAWTAELIAREKTSYYLEQALVAMLVARYPARHVLPAEDYVTFPHPAEAQRPTAVLHHFVDTSKRWYFQHSWRHALSRLAPLPLSSRPRPDAV